MSRSLALRALLTALGGVATGAGIHSAVAGDRSVPGGGGVDLRADSELRYFGVFYAAYGLATLRTAAHNEPQPSEVRAVAGVLFSGGIARANGWRMRGRPHPGQIALLAAELSVPAVLLLLQAPSTRSV